MLVEFGATNIIEYLTTRVQMMGMNYGLGASVALTLLKSEIQHVAYDPAFSTIHYETCLDICPFTYVPFPKNIVP